ncbi:MAG: putative bifunctional diguanylate cyclase/phosphodiesterase [Acidimicrobiales bacterium]
MVRGHTAAAGGALFDRTQFRMRIGIVLALALACAWLPVAGDNRALLAIFLLGVAFPAHFVIRRIVGVPNPTGLLDLLAVVSGSVVAAIEPTLWSACFLFQMLNIAGSVAFLRPIWTVRLASTSLATMGIVATLRPVDGAVAHLVVAAVFMPALIVGATAKVERERKSTVRLSAVSDSVPVLVWEAETVTGALHWITGRCEELLGVDRAKLQSSGFTPYIHHGDAAGHFARLRGPDDRLRVLEYRFLRPDGQERWLRDQVEWVTTAEGRVLRGVTIDVTDERHHRLGMLQRQQLIDRLDQMSLVLDRTDDHLVVIAATDPFGWLGGPLERPHDMQALLPFLASEPHLQAALDRLHRDGTLRLPPMLVVDPHDEPRHLEIDLCELPGGSIGMLVDDVTERERANAKILHQARHDHLTGLANRAVLLAAMTERFERGDRLALLLLDLNGFKNVNDTLGHLTGDKVLEVIADRLRRLCGRDDVIARLGGDEFAILVEGGDPGDVEVLVAEVLDRCRTAVRVESVSVVLGASVGVAFGPLHASEAEGLLRRADVAMYAAKRNEQGHRYFSPDLNADRHHLELLGALTDAFIGGQFVLRFQPKVCLRTRRVVGAEALVRWEHPELGLLAPDDFLGLVSMAGYGDEMGDVTMSLAAQATLALPDDLTVSVNLTANNLRQSDLVRRTIATAAVFGVDLSRLMIEITESHVIDNTGVIHRTIHEFADAGVGVSIDDFGTGYSSMVNLRSLPLDELKVDRTFVDAMTTSSPDEAIVRSVIGLGHSLGLSVTAEGVEDPATAQRLEAMGADVAQGYLFGRPMLLEELVALVDRQAPVGTR